MLLCFCCFMRSIKLRRCAMDYPFVYMVRKAGTYYFVRCHIQCILVTAPQLLYLLWRKRYSQRIYTHSVDAPLLTIPILATNCQPPCLCRSCHSQHSENIVATAKGSRPMCGGGGGKVMLSFLCLLPGLVRQRHSRGTSKGHK